MIRQDGLAQYGWLTQSTGWAGSGAGNANAQGWSIVQGAGSTFNGTAVDLDTTASGAFGAWPVCFCTRTLISTPNRERNAMWLRPEEAGWMWTQEHLAKTLPLGQIALHNLTVRLDAHPRAKGGNLVDVIDTSPKAGQMDPALADVVDA